MADTLDTFTFDVICRDAGIPDWVREGAKVWAIVSPEWGPSETVSAVPCTHCGVIKVTKQYAPPQVIAVEISGVNVHYYDGKRAASIYDLAHNDLDIENVFQTEADAVMEMEKRKDARPQYVFYEAPSV